MIGDLDISSLAVGWRQLAPIAVVLMLVACDRDPRASPIHRAGPPTVPFELQKLQDGPPPWLAVVLNVADRSAQKDLISKDPTLIDRRDTDGWTVLHWAIRQANVELVKHLISSGVDVNEGDRLGLTPLHLTMDTLSRPLTASSSESDRAYVKELIQAGLAYSDRPMSTGHLEVARILIANGADLDRSDRGGATPLHRAIVGGHFRMVQMLLDAGADCDVTDQRGMTLLHIAVMSGSGDQHKIIEMLLRSGAPTNHRDETGNTPRMWASNLRMTRVVEILDTHAAEESGRTDGRSSRRNHNRENTRPSTDAGAHN